MAVEHARIGGQVPTLHSPSREGLSSLRDAETQGTPHVHISPALSLAISGDHFPPTAAREVQGARRRSLSLGTQSLSSGPGVLTPHQHSLSFISIKVYTKSQWRGLTPQTKTMVTCSGCTKRSAHHKHICNRHLHARTSTWILMCTCTRRHPCMHIHVCKYTLIHLYTDMHMYASTHICTKSCIAAHIYIPPLAYRHEYKCACMCAHV